ncbi:MAG: tetratricopeptide repeat protein [Saccharofermentans sp.]|nr:tetratricopeptide repeat protein [Saccharofermentans sp.]
MAKRIIAGLWIVLVLLLGVLLFADISNRNFISNFNNGIYEQNRFGFLGFWEPHVNHYNRGNLYYSLGDYERAIEEYQEALSTVNGKPYDCMTRINYALSLVVPLDLENVNEDNVDDILAVLYEARDILCENDCARENSDHGGHDSDAQKLKNQIDELIDLLENPPEPSDTPEPEPSGEPSDTPSVSPSPSPEPSEEPTPSPETSETPTPSPSPDPNATPTPTDEPEPSGEPSATPTPTVPGLPLTPPPNPNPTEEPEPYNPEEGLENLMNDGLRDRYGSNASGQDVWNYGSYTPW